jgi:CheY-like chemotaxis protein
VKAILVVDDEFGIVDSLCEVLTDEGFSVRTAANGKDALRKMAEQRPDLVLMDYMMPIMDGQETVNAMQEDAALRDVPVVMMSSVPRPNLPHGGALAGFLRKPFDLDVLLAEVARVLGE